MIRLVVVEWSVAPLTGGSTRTPSDKAWKRRKGTIRNTAATDIARQQILRQSNVAAIHRLQYTPSMINICGVRGAWCVWWPAMLLVGFVLLDTLHRSEAVFEKNHFVANGGTVKNEFQLVKVQLIQNDDHSANYSIVDATPLLIPRRGCADNSPAEITVNFVSTNQSSEDWIGFYSPANVNITTVVPIKLGYCSDSSTYLSEGIGSLRFRLTNPRATVAVYMFRGGLSSPVAVDKLNSIIKFEDENEPLAPRVSADDGTKELRVSWSSKNSKKPELRWGAASGEYSRTVSAETSYFNKSMLFGAPAATVGWVSFGALHNAVLNGISGYSGSRLYYQFGDRETADYSCEYVLDVPLLRRPKDISRPASFIAFGDMGRPGYDDAMTWFHYGRPAAKTLSVLSTELNKKDTDGIFFLGDISYASGYMGVWNEFLDSFSLLASRTPVFPVPGNHEADAIHDPADAILYQNSVSGGEGNAASAFLLPMPNPATCAASWWSFDIDSIHLIGIDTESNVSVGSLQYAWLEEDLKSVDRSETPWVVLGGHRPMYVDSYLDPLPSSMAPVMDLMIKELEPLLWKYQVNLALWAHHHSYQRHAAVYDQTIVQKSEEMEVLDAMRNPETVSVYNNPQATVHMVLGTGGADYNLEDSGETVKYPYPESDSRRQWYSWSEVFFYRHGFTKVTALNSTHLDITFRDSNNGTICDHAMLISSSNSPGSKSWRLGGGKGGGHVGVALAIGNALILCFFTLRILHSRSDSML